MKKVDWNFMCTLKSICVPNFSSLGWFSFSSTVISCHQLLTAVESWWQLIWKQNYWNFHVLSIGDIFAKFQLSRLILIFINCYQLSSAVDSCWQLKTADMKKNSTGICMHTLKLILAWFSFESTVISCWQLLAADDSCWQLSWHQYHNLQSKVDKYAKFQLNQMIR